METKFMFNGQVYNTRADAESAVSDYAGETYDDMLDSTNDPVIVNGFTYAPSYVLRFIDEIAYRCGLGDYEDSLLPNIQEIETNEE